MTDVTMTDTTNFTQLAGEIIDKKIALMLADQPEDRERLDGLAIGLHQMAALVEDTLGQHPSAARTAWEEMAEDDPSALLNRLILLADAAGVIGSVH